MQTTLSKREARRKSRTQPALDLLVVEACDLVIQKEQVYQKIRRLARHTKRASSRRGLWLFIVIRYSHRSPETYARERDIARQVTREVTGWCQGAITVEEKAPELTARAVLDFHQLHFPDVRAEERPSRIVVLGSAKELALSRSFADEEG
jgi:hypothetical protein